MKDSFRWSQKVMAGLCLLTFGSGIIQPVTLWAARPTTPTITSSQVTSGHLAFPNGKETNPSISFNPANPQYGLVAYADSKNGTTRVAGLGLTKDGGLSFNNKKMDSLWDDLGSSYVSYLGTGDADGPKVFCNSTGRCYYLTPAVPKTDLAHQIPIISYSDDSGKNWSLPVALPSDADNANPDIRYLACQGSTDPRNNDVLIACRKDIASDRPYGTGIVHDYHQSQMVLFTSHNGGAFASTLMSVNESVGDGAGTADQANGQILFYPSPPVVGANAEGGQAIYVAYGYRDDRPTEHGPMGYQIFLYKKAPAAVSNQFITHVLCLNRVTPFGSHIQPSIPRLMIAENGVVHCIAGTCLAFTYQLLDIWSDADGHFRTFSPFVGNFVETPVSNGAQPKNWKPVLPSLASPSGEDPSLPAAFASWGRDAIWNGWPAKHGYTLNRSVDSKNLKIAYKSVSPVSGTQQVLSLWLRDQRDGFMTGAVVGPLLNFVASPYQQAAILSAIAASQLDLDTNGNGEADEQETLRVNLVEGLKTAFDQFSFFQALISACDNTFGAGSPLAAACFNTLSNEGAFILFNFNPADLVTLCANAGVTDATACANAILASLNESFLQILGLDHIPSNVLDELVSAGIGNTPEEAESFAAQIFAAAFDVGRHFGAPIDAALIQACKNLFNDPAKQTACFQILFAALPDLFGNAPAGSPAADAYNLIRGVVTVLDTIRDNLVTAGVPPIAAEYAARTIWLDLLNGASLEQACAHAVGAANATACAAIVSGAIDTNFGTTMAVGDHIDILVTQIILLIGGHSLPSTFPNELSEIVAQLMDQFTVGSGTEFYRTLAVGYPEGVDLVADMYATSCSFDADGLLICPEADKVSGPTPMDGTTGTWSGIPGIGDIGAPFPGMVEQPDALMANYGTEIGVASTGTATCVAHADMRNAENCPDVEKLQYAYEQCGNFIGIQAATGLIFTWADCQRAFQTMGLGPFDLGNLADPDDIVGTLNGTSINSVCPNGFDNSDIYVSCKR